MGLTIDQIIVFSILAATLALFVWGRWRHDLVAMAALLGVFIAGLVPADEVFAGFGHPAVITVAAVLVLSRGLLNAGVVDAISRHILVVGNKPTAQVATLTGIVILCSGFMNNVGALALLMPVAVWMSRKSGRSPSLLLMPLAFGSLAGGLITLIGTPPNIIIALYRAETGAGAFNMFDFTPVGTGTALAVLLFIALFGWRLTPRRTGKSSPEELFEIDDYISEVIVPEDSQFVGQTVFHLTSALEKETEATVVGLVRGERHIPVPSWYEILEAGDIIMVKSAPEGFQVLLDNLGLEFIDSNIKKENIESSDEVGLFEAIVTTESPLIGKTAANARLRREYGVNLLAIARGGKQIGPRLSHTVFVAGDILLLQGAEEKLQNAVKALKCLPLAERGLRVGQPKKILLAVSIFGGAMLLSALNVMPVQVSFALAAVIMILSKIIPLSEVYEHIDWPIIVLLGAMFPLGHALESTGGAQWIAEQMLLLSRWFPPAVILVVLLTGTMLLSNVVNNAAAAVLMAPIAITLAGGIGVSADPFLMAVAVGASCAFLTPVGHQSNALVMEPGGYRFGDYWRLGLPLSILVTAVATPLILYFWPLG